MSPRHLAKHAFLGAAKHVRLFDLARKITAKKLRILCYHGAEIHDESNFRPKLFIKGATFAKRMKHLADNDYPVLTFDNAVKALNDGTLPDAAVTLTIDDGWSGTAQIMVPILQAYGYPAILYVSTYYYQNQFQVLNVAIDYVIWKTKKSVLNLADLHDKLSGRFFLNSTADRESLVKALLAHAATLDSAEAKQSLFRKICKLLDVDWRHIESSRMLSFINEQQARELAKQGVDIQLHTHRHVFPEQSKELAREEVDVNRRILSSVATNPLVHFCYPSGHYSPDQLSWLPEFNIMTATTTKAGLNGPGLTRFELKRFLDSEDTSMLEFEAEVSGFLELLRRVRTRLPGHGS